jgi:acyl-CoA thioester hydrolase
MGKTDSRRGAGPPLPQARQLEQLPLELELRVPPEWEDRNGHVNVQYYLRLFELGGWNFLERDGFGEEWFQRQAYSFFDLEHHLCYLAEIHVGDRVRCYNRMLAVGSKRFHGMYFTLNESRGRLAATLEYISAGIDMRRRRISPIPARLRAALESLESAHCALDWTAPVCGTMMP